MVLIALLTALAIVLHWVESLIPVPYVMPGAKLGLANVVALYVVITMGTARALTLSMLRTTVGSLLGGTFLSPTFILSFSGAVVSTLAMGAVHRLFGNSVGPVGISIVGSVMHNMGQLAAAAYIVRQAGVFFYLPYLLLFALPTGALTGLIVVRIPRQSPGSHHE